MVDHRLGFGLPCPLRVPKRGVASIQRAPGDNAASSSGHAPPSEIELKQHKGLSEHTLLSENHRLTGIGGNPIVMCFPQRLYQLRIVLIFRCVAHILAA